MEGGSRIYTTQVTLQRTTYTFFRNSFTVLHNLTSILDVINSIYQFIQFSEVTFTLQGWESSELQMCTTHVLHLLPFYVTHS